MTWQRARSPEQKAERSDKIVDAAAELFDEYSLDGLSMNALAKRAGMGKASLYHYFATKEHVFLELFKREGDAWIANVIEQLEKLGKSDADSVAHVIATETVRHERLRRLAIVLHHVLDNFASPATRQDFKLYMLEPLEHFADCLQTCLPGVTRANAMLFFMQHHALVVGLAPFSDPDALLDSGKNDARLAIFQLEFAEVFEHSLAALLARIGE